MVVPKPKRKRCRVCSALAGLTADICNGCRMAEVRSHIKQRGRQGEPEKKELHKAHGKSLLTLPPVMLPKGAPARVVSNKDYTASAIFSAVATGIDASSASAIHNFNSETLANAQRFAATLGGVPANASTAQMFFSYSQKSFYAHMRAMLAALDPTKKLPGKKRKNPSSHKAIGKGPQSRHNVALAKAMRFIRIYMHVETIPLALKLDCSQTQLWHIESCNIRVQPKWVEAYARVFEIEEQRIYAYATKLLEYSNGKSDYKEMVTDFVDVCLKGKRVADTAAFQDAIFQDIADVQGVKITKKMAQEIKAALAKGERSALIADRYTISRSAVQDIKKGRTWV